MTDVSAQPTLAAEPDDAGEEPSVPEAPVVAPAIDEEELTERIISRGQAALEELIARTVSPAGPVTLDGSITQGNRVVPSMLLVHDDPMKIITDRVKDHYGNLVGVINDLEASLTQLKALCNKIGVGL